MRKGGFCVLSKCEDKFARVVIDTVSERIENGTPVLTLSSPCLTILKSVILIELLQGFFAKTPDK